MEVNEKTQILFNELMKKNKLNNNFIEKFRKDYMIHLLKQRRSHNEQSHFQNNQESLQNSKCKKKARELKINTQKNSSDYIQAKSQVVLSKSNRSVNKKNKIVENRSVNLINYQNLIKSDNGIKQITLNYQNVKKESFKYKPPKKQHGIWDQNKNNEMIRYKEPLHIIKVSLEKNSLLSNVNNRDNYKSSKKKIAINLKNIQFDEENAFKTLKNKLKAKQKQSHFPLINMPQTKYEWNLRDRSFVNNNENKRESHKSQASQKLIHVNSLLCFKQ